MIDKKIYQFLKSLKTGASFAVLVLIGISRLSSQEWGKYYPDSGFEYGKDIIETYDKGYLFIGSEDLNGGNNSRGIVLKTDINGQLLWKKYIGPSDGYTVPIHINETEDGRILISGITDRYDTASDPFVLLLNQCGELEKLFVVQTKKYNFSSYSVLLDNNTFVTLCYRILQHHNESTTLINFDINGNILWQNTQFIINSQGGVEYVNNDYFLIT